MNCCENVRACAASSEESVPIASKLYTAYGFPALLVAFSNVIRVTTPLIGVKVLSSRVEYLRKRFLLDTGTRTSKGRALSGCSRNSIDINVKLP